MSPSDLDLPLDPDEVARLELQAEGRILLPPDVAKARAAERAKQAADNLRAKYGPPQPIRLNRAARRALARRR